MAARGGAFRIVGGRLGGRRFGRRPPPGTRPTSERVREALASALQARGWIQGAVVLELYAGTGALSFECLSRGARHAVLLEANRRLVEQTRRDAEALGLSERLSAAAMRLPASPERLGERLGPLLPSPATLLLADPPYAQADQVTTVLQALDEAELLAPRLALVVEHDRRHPPSLPPLVQRRELCHGETVMTLGLLERP